MTKRERILDAEAKAGTWLAEGNAALERGDKAKAEAAMPKNPAAVELGRLGGAKASDKQKAAARENGKKGGAPPLRRIVDRHMNQYGATVEVLECGHEQREKQDIYGPTNAYRRRCRQCAKEARP
jgi:hypothetical protein